MKNPTNYYSQSFHNLLKIVSVLGASYDLLKVVGVLFVTQAQWLSHLIH